MTGQLPPQPTAPQMPPPPPIAAGPPSQGRSAWRWGCGLAIAGVLLLVMVGGLLLLLMAVRISGGMDGISTGRGEIALIRIDGMIVAGESGFSMLGGAATGSDDVVDEIETAVEDSDVKGIVLRINSPGGSAAGSQEIYQAVERARGARNGEFVVVASMADVAASGGYYVAAAADKILADRATITGSIGAIALHQDMSGLLEKIGVELEVIKSGALKDMLSPTAPLGDEAREIVRSLVMEVHDQFIADVANGRGMEESAVRTLADGRIYTGQQAKEKGLVDECGGLRDALDAAGELAGVGPGPRVKEYGAPSLLRWLLGSSSSISGRQAGTARRLVVTGGLLYDGLAGRLAGQSPDLMGALGGGARAVHEAPPGEM